MKLHLYFLVLGFVAVAEAENLYVTSSGAGSRNGTSLANAFPGTAGVVWGNGTGLVGPGDTLWMAGGTFGGFSVGASGTAGSRISIKRATANNPECTSSTGWNNSFDSQVVVNGGIYARGHHYLSIDGQVANGIKVAWASGAFVIWIGGNGIELKFLELVGPGYAPSFRVDGVQVSDYPNTSNGILFHRIKVRHCSNGFFVDNCINLTMEYNIIQDNDASGVEHPNAVWTTHCRNVTFRYNELFNYGAEGYVLGGNHPSIALTDNHRIYGNVFRDTTGSGRAIEIDSGNNGSFETANIFIYNNVFANLWMSIRGECFRPNCFGGGARGGLVYNNIFWNAPSSFSTLSHDYNWYNGSSALGEAHGIAGGVANSPFVNLAAKNYRIKDSISPTMPRNKATALSQEFNHDQDRNQRGSDGFWDIGAYESGISVQPVAVHPPKNMRIVTNP